MKAIILAGGCGSRLWPLSRDMYPKQLLSIGEDSSLLQQTVLRLQKYIGFNDILTVTNVKHTSEIKRQLDMIGENGVVLGEPLGKNTGPAVASALEYLQRNGDANEIVMILPSDHLIKDAEKFNRSIAEACELAGNGNIVTFGIKPAYPETGYGYVKTGAPLAPGFKVDKFVEKPDLETAKKYLADGSYYWNGGIFVSKISVLLAEFERFMPEIFNNLSDMKFDNGQIDYRSYEKMPSISIDYAVMEKSDRIALVPLYSDWNDLGSWQAIYDVKPKDDDGNVLSGKTVVHNVRNSLIYSQKEIVAVADLEGIVLVETEDAIMACRMEDSQNVKKLYEKLKAENSSAVMLHKTVARPWGYYSVTDSGDGYLNRTLCVLPHKKLSMHLHRQRSEHWVVLSGEAVVVTGNGEVRLHAGDSFDVPAGMKHSLQNPQDTELKIIEVRIGKDLTEADIERF